MTKMKKLFLTTVFSALTFLMGALALALPKTEKVEAAAETTYTTVDTPVMARIGDVYAGNGNFNLWITLPQMDVDATNNVQFLSEGNLINQFNELNFFDNVLIGEKTLKELGVNDFFEDNDGNPSIASFKIAIGRDAPKNMIQLHCHADPAIWAVAVSAGEVNFSQSEVTVKEGALIPGYTYLTGAENPTVYRASMDCVTRIPTPDLSYSRVTYGQAEIDSLLYTAEWDTNYNNAYLGISFNNDDYLNAEDNEVQYQDSWGSFENREEKLFTKTILVNGLSGQVTTYGLFNLGEKGKGHLSFVIKVPQEECVSITIPKGTLFPMYAMNSLRKINTATVFMFYETQKDETFYMGEDGTFVGYTEYAIQQVENYKAEEGFFRSDEAAQRAQIVAETLTAIGAATGDAEIETALTLALERIDALKTAAQYADEELAEVKASARAEIENHLKDIVYLTEQATERTQAIEAGLAGVAAAKSETEIFAAVAAAKVALEAITPKQIFVDAAIAELTAYKADAAYFDEQKAEKDALISTAKTAIQNALSQVEIEEELASAKSEIDEIATIADMLDSYKETALGKINEKKATIKYDEYLEETHKAINDLYFNAKKAVKNSMSEAEIDQAVEAYVKAVDALPKINLNVKGGCGNTLGAGAIFGVLTLVGSVLLLRKGKDE